MEYSTYVKIQRQRPAPISIESGPMEEMFGLGRKVPERSDISLCIFPHLTEFIAVDMRWDTAQVALLNTADIFGDAFFDNIEHGFRHILREDTAHPFAHLIDLPLKVEELIRETGMISILDKLGTGTNGDQFPRIAVFILSGAALTMSTDQILHALRSLLGEDSDPSALVECTDLLERLIAEEQVVVKNIDREEIREALEEQSPNFFTLWERRN